MLYDESDLILVVSKCMRHFIRVDFETDVVWPCHLPWRRVRIHAKRSSPFTMRVTTRQKFRGILASLIIRWHCGYVDTKKLATRTTRFAHHSYQTCRAANFTPCPLPFTRNLRPTCLIATSNIFQILLERWYLETLCKLEDILSSKKFDCVHNGGF